MKRTLCALLLPAFAALAQAQEPAAAYQQPSSAVRAVLDARSLPSPSVDPSGRTLALVETRRYPAVDELSRPFHRLAGARIDAASGARQRVARYEKLSFVDIATGASRDIALPAGGDFHELRFSPDGNRFVVQRKTATALELWTGETRTGTLKRIEGANLVNPDGDDPAWIGSGTVVVRVVPANRGAAPAEGAPTGPVVRESFGKRSPEVTYQDLLKNTHDEALFDHYFTGQLARIDLASGTVKRFGAPGIYTRVTPMADGSRYLVERAVKPYSRAVPLFGFASQPEILDGEGRVVRTLARIPARENVPSQGVILGPRNLGVSPLADAALYWTEALDEGDPRKKVPHRDKLMKLAAPYTGEPVEVARFQHRLANMAPMEDGRALATEYDRDRVWTKTFIVDGNKPGAEPVLLFDRSLRDRYNAPGNPVTTTLPSGHPVIRVTNGAILLVGPGATPQGDRPFLDRMVLADKSTTRLFRAGTERYETILRPLDGEGTRFLTARESPTEVPNIYLNVAGKEAVALTKFADPTPQIRAIKRELVRFKRKDGVDQSFWLYRPTDQKPGEKRPALVWAYPQEFTDAALAGQVAGAANRFEIFTGTTPLFLVLEGYVVLMDTTMPVVGDPEKVNDTFVEQITMNAEAAIAKAAELGVVDPARVAVGGHSYGAFMTANLLAHTDLFKTGIARSGAYNRTLTPFGFQAERRTLWEAPNAYIKLSPFLVADKLREPILLLHGEVDNNPGTYPEQSDRLFAALAGTGGHVRLVKLPAESHGYAARESVGHTLWEMSAWLRKHLGDPRAP